MDKCVDNILHTVLFPKYENLIKRDICLEIYQKIPQIDVVKFDDPDMYDKVTRAINESDNRALEMLWTLRGLMSSTIQTLVLFVSLIFLSPISIVIGESGTH